LVHGVSARDFERETHIRENVEPRKQDRILEDDPEEAVPSRGSGRLAAHRDNAARRDIEVGDETEERGFPAATRTDERHEFAVPYIEAHVADRGQRPGIEVRDLADVGDGDRDGSRADGRGYGGFVAVSGVAVVVSPVAVIV